MYLPYSCSALFYGHSGFLWSRGFCSSTHAGKCCSHLFCGRYKIVSFVWTMNTYYLEFNQNCPFKNLLYHKIRPKKWFFILFYSWQCCFPTWNDLGLYLSCFCNSESSSIGIDLFGCIYVQESKGVHIVTRFVVVFFSCKDKTFISSNILGGKVKESWKKCFHKNIKLRLIIIRNGSWAANLHIRLISEGLFDTWLE